MIGPIALIGFGEVGQIFASDLSNSDRSQILAWDIAFADPSSSQSAAARAAGVRIAANGRDAVAGATLAISAVTAGDAMAAANAAAPGLEPGTFWLDVNSVSPGTRQAVAAEIEGRGGRFVEAAVMTPVPGRGLAAPMLLGGPHVRAFMAELQGLSMDLKHFSDRVGPASAVKMCRSVMVKGMEALFLEAMVAARYHGVEREVLTSLTDMIDQDWEKLGGYMMSRALVHGRRRAEEMREVARTVAETGLDPLQSAATAMRQDWAADRNAEVGPVATTALAEILDLLVERET